MIELRVEINKLLKAIHDRVHYQRAADKTLYPHIVYNFPNSFTDDDQEVFNLDVDIYDKKEDTTELETIASEIWRLFHRYYHIDSNTQFSVHRDNRLPPLDDDDKHLKRRKLIFQLRYFDRQL